MYRASYQGDPDMMNDGSMMDDCMEMMSSMMGGNMMDGMMSNSFPFLPIVGALLIVWLISLATLGGLGFWAIRRFTR